MGDTTRFPFFPGYRKAEAASFEGYGMIHGPVTFG